MVSSLSRVNEGVELRSVVYIPLFCLPLPKKHNPVIVLPIKDSKITVSVEVLGRQGLELSGVPPIIDKYVYDFYEFILNELGVNYGFRIDVDGDYIYNGFIYVAITNLMIRLLSGRLSNDEYGLLRLVDSRLGISDCITAIREYEVVGGSYIWRYDGELLKLPDISCYAREVLSTEDVSLSSVVSNEVLATPLTRLVGLLIISIYNSLIEKDYKSLSNYIRLYNSLWVGVSGIADGVSQSLKPFTGTNFYIYIQDLGRVTLFEVQLVFKGG
jgi:hypothetical protein